MSLIVDSIIKCSFKTLSSDNLSVVLICFEGFKNLFDTPNLAKQALKLKEMLNEKLPFYPYDNYQIKKKKHTESISTSSSKNSIKAPNRKY